jgi:hypothetical protein
VPVPTRRREKRRESFANGKGDLAMWRSRMLTELPLVMSLVVLYLLAVLF